MAARARGTSLVLAAVGCLATQLQVASSTVTVLAPLNATGLRPNTKIPSSTYVYFGPRPGYELSAPGVFLSNREACAPNPVTVKGKVVVTRNTLADCLIEDIYESLGNYGAAAYVVLVPYNPPGMRAFRHNDWIINKNNHRTMPMVSISEDDRLSLLWKDSGLLLAVGGESDERFVDYCRSWMRITIMQVLIPSFALYSAAIARKSLLDTLHRHGIRAGNSADVDVRAISPEDNIPQNSQKIALRNMKVQPWPIAAVVCAIEAPTLVLLGAVLALGQNGPMLLPHTVHLICSDLFLGISLLTSLLVALYLQDEAPKDSGNDAQPPPSSTWSKHRRKLMAAAVALTLSAAAPLFNIFVPTYWKNFGGLFFAFVYAPLTVGCSAYFLYKAWLFREHIVLFICQRDALAEQFGPFAQSFRLVGCLAFWLLVSAICMLINAAILVSVAVTMLGVGKSGVATSLINLEHFLVLESLMAVSRIGISLAQVFAISHHSVVEEGLFGRNCFTCCGCFGVAENVPGARKRRKAPQTEGGSEVSDFSMVPRRRISERSGGLRDNKNRVTPTNGPQGGSLLRPAQPRRKSSDQRKMTKLRGSPSDKRRRSRSHNAVHPEPAPPLDGENTSSNNSSDTAEAHGQDTEDTGDGLRPSPSQESMLSKETLNDGWCDLHGDYLFAMGLLEGQLDETKRENTVRVRSPGN